MKQFQSISKCMLQLMPTVFVLILSGCATATFQCTPSSRKFYTPAAPINVGVMTLDNRTDGDYTYRMTSNSYLKFDKGNPEKGLSDLLSEEIKALGMFSTVNRIDLPAASLVENIEKMQRDMPIDAAFVGELYEYKAGTKTRNWFIFFPFSFLSIIGLPTFPVSYESHMTYDLKLVDLLTRKIIWTSGKQTSRYKEKLVFTSWSTMGRDMKKYNSQLVNAFMADNSSRLVEYAQKNQTVVLTKPVVPPITTESPQKSNSSTASAPTGKGRRWAVVIGISDYTDPQIGRLAYADDDARSMKNWLVRDGFVDADHIMALLDNEADKRSIETALYGFLGKVNPEDTIIIFWSGHGYVDPQDNKKTYFACYDTEVLKPWTGLSMGDVRRILEGHGTRNMVFLADTCHSGGIFASRGINVTAGTGATNEYVEKIDQASPGTVFFVAGDTDRKALETKQFKNGLFTHILLEALSGKADGFHGAGNKDRIITLGEMMEYVEDKLPKCSMDALGYIQRPAKFIGSGDENVRNLQMGVAN